PGRDPAGADDAPADRPRCVSQGRLLRVVPRPVTGTPGRAIYTGRRSTSPAGRTRVTRARRRVSMLRVIDCRADRRPDPVRSRGAPMASPAPRDLLRRPSGPDADGRLVGVD